MTALREAAQQALEALEYYQHRKLEWDYSDEVAVGDLRAALAQEQAEPLTGLDMFLDPQDELKPKRYKLKAEPAQERAEPLNLLDRAVQRRLAAQWGYVPAERAEPVAWVASEDGYTIQGVDFTHDVVLRVSGDFENDAQRIRRAKQIVDALNAAPPRRTMVPLTDEEIDHAANNILTDDPVQWWRKLARAVEKASWEKNHG